MKAIKYSYAKARNNKITHISEAIKGEAYFCLSCGTKLSLRAGTKKVKHFSHTPKAKCSNESYLHILAKQRFCAWFNSSSTTEVKLKPRPLTICSYKDNHPLTDKPCPFYEDYSCSEIVEVTDEQDINLKDFFAEAREEVSYHKDGKLFRTDVLLRRKDKDYIDDDNKVIFIEFCVSHKCEEAKINSGIRIIEFIIESEEDIDRIISNTISEGDKTKFFNFNFPKEFKAPSEFNGRILHTFGIDRSGNPIRNRGYAHCSDLTRYTGFSLTLTTTNNNLAVNRGIYMSPYLINRVLCHHKNKEFKDCALCIQHKLNDNDEYICLCYKQVGLARLCEKNNPYTCGHFQLNNTLVNKVGSIIREYLKIHPYIISKC